MENKKDIMIRVLFSLIILGILLIFVIRKPNDIVVPQMVNTCKEDSLQSVINQLQIEFDNEEDGWDNKEKRYEDVLFEYEYGLDHLKNYHLNAYKDFHRIISHREHYSHEIERENVKRLQVEKL